MKVDIFDLLALLGLLILSVGFGLLNFAYGLIVGGGGLLIFALLGSYSKHRYGGDK